MDKYQYYHCLQLIHMENVLLFELILNSFYHFNFILLFCYESFCFLGCNIEGLRHKVIALAKLTMYTD